eukprot:COSAG01_NODE_3276_length_6317_cov_44.552428_2_plen_47_part_00
MAVSAGAEDDDEDSSGDSPPTTNAGTVNVVAATDTLDARARRLVGN